jgi:hypothetical protein
VLIELKIDWLIDNTPVIYKYGCFVSKKAKCAIFLLHHRLGLPRMRCT